MNWMDYRDKLGIGFADKEKAVLLAKKIALFIKESPINRNYTEKAFYRFRLMTGVDRNYSVGSSETSNVSFFFSANANKLSITESIAYYIAFVNSQASSSLKHRQDLIGSLCIFLEELNISCEVIWDDDGAFIFPKGAKELDDALVSQPLEWLRDYPDSQKAFVRALKAYADVTDDTASETADKFRKALETFLQEFFHSEQSMEQLKKNYGSYLKTRGVPKEVSGNLETLLQMYANYMNNYAKHHDKTSKNVLEYIMYQTGNIIRLLISLKREE